VRAVILPLALSVLIGVTLAALGGGGAILTVPLLVHLAGVPPQKAIPMSMVIVGATSAFASLLHLRQGNLEPRTAVLFGLAGAAGAWVGSRLTHLLSERTLMLLFAALLVFVSARMLQAGDSAAPSTDRRSWRCLLAGLGVGVLTGFLGVGGGFLLVPALIFFAHLSPRRAAGTSLAIIAANSAAGLAGHLSRISLDWQLTLAFFGCTLAGMFGGLAVSRRTPDVWLKRAFAGLVMAMGLLVALLNSPH
jgi:uncharacterized membrane protein YfcA